MSRALPAASLIALALCAAALPARAQGDPAAGEAIFKRCIACHAVGPAAADKVGPRLNGVVDAVWGVSEKFARYSPGLKEGKAAGRVWDEATLAAYLEAPKKVIPRGTMAFAGLRQEKERADVIAYLRQFGPDGEKAE